MKRLGTVTIIGLLSLCVTALALPEGAHSMRGRGGGGGIGLSGGRGSFGGGQFSGARGSFGGPRGSYGATPFSSRSGSFTGSTMNGQSGSHGTPYSRGHGGAYGPQRFNNNYGSNRVGPYGAQRGYRTYRIRSQQDSPKRFMNQGGDRSFKRQGFSYGRLFYPKYRHDRDKHRGHYNHHHYYYGYGYDYFPAGFLFYPWYYYPGYYYPAYVQESVPGYQEAYADYGFLELDITPEETDIFLDGEYMGKAMDYRDEAISVSPGEHELRLSLKGFSSYFQVYIGVGSTTYFSKDLSFDPSNQGGLGRPSRAAQAADTCPSEVEEGVLNVRVEPDDADVYLDGKRLGDAEGLMQAGIVLPEGTHTIRLEADGHEPHEETIQVRCEQPVQLDVDMVRKG